MPIYMDRHIVPGITLADATEAHKLDVAIQDEYNCKAITFWLDEERGCAFCLIEAPNEQAVRDLHNSAHGLIPHEIIEVEKNLVMAFLGRINDPESDPELSNGSRTSFYDPAYRAIMVTRLHDAALIPSKYGKNNGEDLFSIYKRIIEGAIRCHNGREVHHAGDDFLISFASVCEALKCAVEIQNECDIHNSRSPKKIYNTIGLSSGDPVTDKGDLFGEAVQMAKRLCYFSAGRAEILVSSEVMEKNGGHKLRMLSEGKRVRFLSSAEEDFLNSLMDVIEMIWDQPDFKLANVCRQIGLSRSQLYRNITSLTGKSFVDFTREFRLKQALKLIEKDRNNITRAAFSCGFNSPSYFSKCFKEQFGILPSEFIKTL